MSLDSQYMLERYEKLVNNLNQDITRLNGIIETIGDDYEGIIQLKEQRIRDLEAQLDDLLCVEDYK